MEERRTATKEEVADALKHVMQEHASSFKKLEWADKIEGLTPNQKETKKIIDSLFDAAIKVKSTIETLQDACSHEVTIETSTEPVFGKEQSHLQPSLIRMPINLLVG
jgi:hypothetical protein